MTRDNRDIRDRQPIDQLARALHARAVERVPARTLARLQPRPQGGRQGTRVRPERSLPGWFARPAGWGLATACAAVFVFAAGMYVLVAPDALDPQPFPADAMAVVNAGLPATPALDPYDDPLSTFEEDPDLFVWLASEAQPVAME